MLARFVPVRSSGCRFVQVRKAGVKRFADRAFRRALNQSLQSIVSTGKQKKRRVQGPTTAGKTRQTEQQHQRGRCHFGIRVTRVKLHTLRHVALLKVSCATVLPRTEHNTDLCPTL